MKKHILASLILATLTTSAFALPRHGVRLSDVERDLQE